MSEGQSGVIRRWSTFLRPRDGGPDDGAGQHGLEVGRRSGTVSVAWRQRTSSSLRLISSSRHSSDPADRAQRLHHDAEVILGALPCYHGKPCGRPTPRWLPRRDCGSASANTWATLSPLPARGLGVRVERRGAPEAGPLRTTPGHARAPGPGRLRSPTADPGPRPGLPPTAGAVPGMAPIMAGARVTLCDHDRVKEAQPPDDARPASEQLTRFTVPRCGLTTGSHPR